LPVRIPDNMVKSTGVQAVGLWWKDNQTMSQQRLSTERMLIVEPQKQETSWSEVRITN
jgi:hypothetical protein